MTRRRGRPLGEKAVAFYEAVRIQPRPLRAIAFDLRLTLVDAQNARATLMRRGLIKYGDQVPGAHDKPARVLEPAEIRAPLVFRLFP